MWSTIQNISVKQHLIIPNGTAEIVNFISLHSRPQLTQHLSKYYNRYLFEMLDFEVWRLCTLRNATIRIVYPCSGARYGRRCCFSSSTISNIFSSETA